MTQKNLKHNKNSVTYEKRVEGDKDGKPYWHPTWPNDDRIARTIPVKMKALDSSYSLKLVDVLVSAKFLRKFNQQVEKRSKGERREIGRQWEFYEEHGHGLWGLISRVYESNLCEFDYRLELHESKSTPNQYTVVCVI